MLKPYRCWLSASSTSSTVVRRQANLLAAQPAALAFLLKYDDHRSCQPSWTPGLGTSVHGPRGSRAGWAALRSDRTASGPKCKLSQSSVNPKRKRDPLRAGQGHSRCRIHVPRMPTHSMVHVESGSGFRFGSQIYVKVLIDAESSTYYGSVNTSGRGDSGATPAWATPFCAGVPN